MSEVSLFTRLNGNGISKKVGDKTMKTILISVLVVVILILVGWTIWKTMYSSTNQNLKAVVSPVRPMLKPPVSNEKVRVVKVSGGNNPNEAYDNADLGEDTISDPDFLMGIGKDSMADVRNQKKTIDDIQYSSPQDLLGIDSVLQADALVQAEDKSKTASIGLINPGTVTPRYIRGGQNPYSGDIVITPQTNQSVVSASVTSSTNVNTGWAGVDDIIAANNR